MIKKLSKPGFFFFSPANFTPEEEIKMARDHFSQSLGVKAYLPPPMEKFFGFHGNDSQRAEWFNSLLSNPQVENLMAIRGGFGSVRLMSFIHRRGGFEINGRKKIFGFSDLTILLNYLEPHPLVEAFHGPMLSFHFGKPQSNQIMTESFKTYLHGWEPFPFEFKGRGSNLPVKGDLPSGRIIGGNLTLLSSSWGTPFAPKLKKAWLFLEDISEPSYSIDRMLQQLSLQKDFHQLKGILFGAFLNCKVQPKGSGDMTFDQVVDNFSKNFNLPIIQGFPCGHLYDSLCVPLGGQLTLSHEGSIFKGTLNRKR